MSAKAVGGQRMQRVELREAEGQRSREAEKQRIRKDDPNLSCTDTAGKRGMKACWQVVITYAGKRCPLHSRSRSMRIVSDPSSRISRSSTREYVAAASVRLLALSPISGCRPINRPVS